MHCAINIKFIYLSLYGVQFSKDKNQLQLYETQKSHVNNVIFNYNIYNAHSTSTEKIAELYTAACKIRTTIIIALPSRAKWLILNKAFCNTQGASFHP